MDQHTLNKTLEMIDDFDDLGELHFNSFLSELEKVLQREDALLKGVERASFFSCFIDEHKIRKIRHNNSCYTSYYIVEGLSLSQKEIDDLLYLYDFIKTFY